MSNTTPTVADQKTETTSLLDIADLECCLCLKLYCEPVTTPCGHTFCRYCLMRSLDQSSNCPICRSVFHFWPDQPINVVIQNLIKKHFTTEYKQRKEEMDNETQPPNHQLPIFVLDVVLFPKMILPLHIFEPRYRLMIKRCLESNRQFGVVNGANAGIHGNGTIALIQTISHLPDGRSLVGTIGTQRFTIKEKWVMDGYLCARVDLFNEEEPNGETAEQKESRMKEINELVKKAHEILGALDKNKLEVEFGTIPNDYVGLSFWLASILPGKMTKKQELLEMCDTLQRLRICVDILTKSANSSGCGVQ